MQLFVKYSPKNIHELILYYKNRVWPRLLPKELESFFISWTNRKPQKPLSLVIVDIYEKNLDAIHAHYENKKIIEKYIKLGVIKNFKSL